MNGAKAARRLRRGATPAVSLSVGIHTLTLEVTDDDGDSGNGHAWSSP